VIKINVEFAAMNMPHDLIPLGEARHLLGVSDNKVTSLVKAGLLKTYTDLLDRRKKLVSRAEVEALKVPRAEAA
jgi:DNA-binding MarR family transcriptional regulator